MLAGKAAVQQAIGKRRRLSRSGSWGRAGKRYTEAHRIHLGEGVRPFIVACNEISRILGRTEKWFQLLHQVVIEAQVAGRKLLFQHAGVDEQP